MRTLLLAVMALAFGNTAAAGPIDKLDMFTEEYPPYNMVKDGETTGISVDILAAILDRADTTKTVADVRVVPWARGYKAALREPNTLLFVTTRTEKREDTFIWVGPIAPTQIGVIGRVDAPAIDTVADMADDKTATIRDDVAEQLLIEAGLPRKAIHSTAKFESIVNLLERGRVDYWGYETNVAKYVLKKHGIVDNYETKRVLQTADLYYAFHKQTDPAAVAAFRNAFEAVKASDRYDAILDRYLK